MLATTRKTENNIVRRTKMVENKIRFTRIVVSILFFGILGACEGDLVGRSYVSGDFVDARDRAKAILKKDGDGGQGMTLFVSRVTRFVSRDALSLLGWSEFMLGNLSQAERAFRRLQEKDRSSFDALLGLAWVHIKRGAHGRADDYLDAAEIQAGPYFKFLVVDARGWNSLGMGDIERAEKIFRREDYSYGDYQPPQDEAMVGLGWAALLRGRLDEATNAFNDGIGRAYDPTLGACYLCYDGLAEVALARGDAEAALRATQSALQHTQSHPKVVGTLTRVLQKISNPDRQRKILTDLAQAYPRKGIYFEKLGWLQINASEPIAARRSFDQALRLMPASGSARAGLDDLTNLDAVSGWKPYLRGEYSRALRLCQDLAGKLARNRSPAAADCVGWSLYRLKRLREARAAFQRALRIQPEFGSSRRGLQAVEAALLRDYHAAWRLLLLGRFDDARRKLNEARRRLPKDLHWKATEADGWIDYFTGRKQRAEKVFEETAALHPQSALANAGLGYLALDRGDRDRAGKLFFGMAAHGRASPYTAYVLAVQRLAKEKYLDVAQAVLEAGEAAWPLSPDLAWTAVGLHKAQGRLNAAADKAVRAAQLAPAYIAPVFDKAGIDRRKIRDGYLAIAWSAYFAGRNAEALRRFDQYLKAGGDHPNARRGRGFAAFRLGRYAAAIGDLKYAAAFEDHGLKPVREAIRIPNFKKKWRIRYNAGSTIGWAQYRLGRYENAERSFKSVLLSHPEWVDALSGLGYSLLARNRRRAARAAFRMALSSEPAYPDALRGIRLANGRR